MPTDQPRSEIESVTASEQKTILIVDDDESAREIYGTILRKAGYQARRHLPDLIILDLQMPKLDGWETLEELRADPATSDTSILALTIVGGR